MFCFIYGLIIGTGFRLLKVRGIQVKDCSNFDESYSKCAMGESKMGQDFPKLPKHK